MSYARAMSLFVTIDALDITLTHYNHSLTIETRQESRYLPPIKYKLLIIGSFGEVSNSVRVCRKNIPNDQKGSNEWMKIEIDQIREKHKKSHYCEDVSELPGNDEQHSKDYYLEEIKKFLNNCKCGKGKRNMCVYNILTLHITYFSYHLLHWSWRDRHW